MKKIMFWIGVAVLVVGITLFGYGYTTLQNLFAIQQWDLAQTLQPIGLGMSVLGVIMIAYGILVKT